MQLFFDYILGFSIKNFKLLKYSKSKYFSIFKKKLAFKHIVIKVDIIFYYKIKAEKKS